MNKSNQHETEGEIHYTITTSNLKEHCDEMLVWIKLIDLKGARRPLPKRIFLIIKYILVD